MRKKYSLFHLTVGAFVLCGLATSCKSHIYLESAVPQEQGIFPTKITDETQTPVVGNLSGKTPSMLTRTGMGGSRKKNYYWFAGPRLAVSPDGTELAFISVQEDAFNVMVKRATAGGPATQRTFRQAQTIDWGKDGYIYFNDNTGTNSAIGQVDAHKGSLVKQMTSNNNDWSPALSEDGEILYFTRFDSTGPSIWKLNKSKAELTNCSRGFDPTPMPGNPDVIFCSRNSTKGNTELWMLDLKNGDETLILSDANMGFSDPCVSPDGEWVLVVGNSLSTISKKQNTDIFAVRTDGTQLTQITYHPELDMCPVWSPDGEYIYFISSRANKERKFNIWRINNPLR